MDHGRPLRLDAERDAGAGEPCALVCDEGDVRDAADADDPRRGTGLPDPFAYGLEHVLVRQVGNRRPDRVGESGTDGDHDLRRVVSRHRVPALDHERVSALGRTREGGRVDHARKRLEELPARPFEPVAGSRPCVLVRVVHRGVDNAVRVDDRRRLQIVRRHPLALHREHRFRSIGEAALGEGQRHVEPRDAAREQLVRGLDVGGAIAVRHLARVVPGGRGGDLLVRHRRQPELGEHGLDRPRRVLADAERLVLGDGLDPRVHLPVALDREPLVEVVRVEVAAAERVVVPRHHRVPRGDEVGAGEELAHQLGRLPDLRVRRDRVVAGGDLEVEPRREHVLAQDRPGAARNGEHEGDAGDRPVLDSLRAGRAHGCEAARLEIEHRVSLRVAHERLRPGPGREAHLHAARGVRSAEERLRPRRVIAVHEHLLGAVDGQRLRIRDETADRELEIPALLHRALGHHARPAGLRADEEREGVERRVAGDADGRLDLRESAPRRLGRIRGEERRALLQVRDVRLVRGRPARPELLEREHQLDRVEEADDAGQLRRRETARKTDELGARGIERHEHPGELEVVDRHRLFRDVEVEAVGDDEAVDDVEVGCVPAVHAHDDAVLDDELRRGIPRPVRRDEAQLRVRARRAAPCGGRAARATRTAG